MGSYLTINGKENNSKSISYPCIGLLREILPDKKSLHGERVFAMTDEEVAKALYYATKLIDDESLLAQYKEDHSDQYGMDGDMGTIQETFEWIQRCFAETLSEMVIQGYNKIFCEWT